MTKLILQWFLVSMAMTGFLSLLLQMPHHLSPTPATSKQESKPYDPQSRMSKFPPPARNTLTIPAVQISPSISSLDLPNDDELETSFRMMEAGSEAVSRQDLAAAWANVPFDEVLSHIKAETTGRVWLAQEVEHWLVAHRDEGADVVLESLQKVQADEWLVSGLLVQGLAQAATPSAREAIVSVLRNIDSYPPTVAIQVAMAAGQFGATADATLKDTLLQLVDSKINDTMFDLSDVSLDSLARLAQNDSAFQESIAQKLLPWLDTTAENAVKALKTFSDAGINRSDLLTRAREFTEAENEELRFAAEAYLNRVIEPVTASIFQPSAADTSIPIGVDAITE